MAAARRTAGDLAYSRMHGYLADGSYREWLNTLDRLRAQLPAGTTLHPGHGEPAGLEVLDWQRGDIEAFRQATERHAGEDDAAAVRPAVAQAMRRVLPTEELAFLMELSIDPLNGPAGAGR